MIARRYASVLAIAVATASANAQKPAGWESLTPAAVADSLAALKQLDAKVRSAPSDAAAWYRRGMIAWVLAERARIPPSIKGLEWTSLMRLADTSLRRAGHADPTNPRYKLETGKLLLMSNNSFARAAAADFFTDAATAARAGTDTALRVEAATEAGRVYWRRYDTFADRVLPIEDTANVSGGSATQVAKEALYIASMGEGDYLNAEAYFREAYDANPRDIRAFRQLAMLLVDRDRWNEARILARAVVNASPQEPFPRLVLGMAMHRSGQSELAGAAFDSALALFAPVERERLFGFQRLMFPKDTVAFLKTSLAARAEHAERFWSWADPLWSQEGNDARVEFLARVTFAEIRWTVEELGVRGADSDRGDMHIRFGPPGYIRAYGSGFGPLGAQGKITTVWTYPAMDSSFIFVGPPKYGTARGGSGFEEHPYEFLNVATGRVERLPVRTARFRAAADSIDLFIGTRAPMERIRSASVPNAVVRSDFWLFGRDFDGGFQDSATFSGSGNKTWTFRVPQTNWMYRIEATVPGSLSAAQATGWIEAGRDSATGFSTRGLGLSDLLLATSAEPRTSAPRHWNDFTVAPLLGSVPRGGKFDVLWENYELSARDGQARYDITVALQRTRSLAGRIGASVASAVASAVSVDRRDDRVTVKFERTVPQAASIVDRVTVDLGETPSGSYALTLTVTDRVSGRATARTTPFVVDR